MEKVKNIVKNIKDGKILFGNDWWEAIGKAKDFIDTELIGVEVELTIANEEKRQFTFIRKTQAIEKPKDKVVLDKDRLIVRQNVLAHASKFTETIRQCGISSTDALDKIFFDFAEKCEKWIYR